MHDDLSSSPAPVIAPLDTQMRCGIFTNANGDILIIHDRALKSSIQWIEYHEQDNKIFLIHEDGDYQDLGVSIDRKMQQNMKHGQSVSLALLQDGKVVSSQNVSLTIQSD